MKIKTRFAPSPTGSLHIGGLRTALVNYAFAEANGGDFILRIEDTDLNRSDVKFEYEIIDVLNSFNLEFKYLHKQSERTSLYTNIAAFLASFNYAYFDYSDIQRPCMRLKVPKEGSFFDEIRGEIKCVCETDPVILKTGNTLEYDEYGNIKYYPTYYLANTVDDLFSGITHVIRGEEWIPSTLIQVTLRQYLIELIESIPEGKMKSQIENKEPLKYIHLGNIMNPETGKKLSKRDGDFVSATNMILMYDVETVLTYLTQLGGGTKNEPILRDIHDYVNSFDFKNLKSSPANFDLKKLDNISSKFLKEKDNVYFYEKLNDAINLELYASSFYFFEKLLPTFRRRWNSLKQAIHETNQIVGAYTNYDLEPEMKKAILDYGYERFVKVYSKVKDDGILEITGTKEEIKLKHAILKWFLIGDVIGGNTMDYFRLCNLHWCRNEENLKTLELYS